MRNLRMAAVLMIVLLFAIPAAAKEKVVVWHSLDQLHGEPMFNQLADEYRAAHPDIDLEIVNAGGYVETLEKLQVAYAGGAPPNISMTEQTRSAGLYYAGALLSIDEFVKGTNGFNINDFSKAMLGAVTYDGKLYGLPYNTSTPLLYYNKDLFLKSGVPPAAPKTWNDILSYSRKISRDANGDGKTDVYGIDFYAWGWMFEAWTGQNGGRLVNDEVTKFTFATQPNVDAMQFTQDLVHKENVAYYAGGSGYNLFWAGNLAMTERSTASLASNIDQATFEMGVAPLACNKECYAPIGGGNFFMINTGTKAQQAAAWDFFRYITTADNLAKMSVATGYMSARRSSINSPVLREALRVEPRYRATYDQMDVAYTRPKVPFWNAVVGPALSGAFYKTQFAQNGNVRQALEELDRTANAQIQEWRKTLGK